MNTEDQNAAMARLIFNLLLTIVLVVSGTVVSILVFIFGWGLEPKSWAIITIGVLWQWVSFMAFSAIKSNSDRIAR